MERESFEDKEVAKILNKFFISIKVDREERPDIDHIYMAVCQALTGHGGWPLTIIMTSDQEPFFAGTYFSKNSSRGMAGLIDILENVRRGWKRDKEALVSAANSIVKEITPHFTMGHRDGEIHKSLVDRAYDELETTFDDEYGGFGHSPKFPIPHNLSFLLRYWKLTGKEEARQMVEKTLDSMYRGGIFDHIGYGFSRYSTDERWLVPHFEKMLYDNALLAIAYLEGYQATGKTEYARVAEKIFSYVLRDMTHSKGGFYSAEDADSEGIEGKYYVWSPDEIENILGGEDGTFFCHFYGITPKGNFEAKNIPNRIHAEGSLMEDEDIIAPIRHRVLEIREKRIHPHKDDKILTAWNGLMIASLAIGSRVLNKGDYVVAAEKALDFILDNLKNQDGRLLARYRDGDSAHLAYLDDYAFLIWGILELYETTFKAEYIMLALDMNREMIELFLDKKSGGLFLYAKDGESLIARPKEVYDGALPSGNSVAIHNMLRLARITGDYELEELAYNQLKAFAETVGISPSAHTHFLMAVMFCLYPTQEIVIVGDRDQRDTEDMIETLHNSFLPQSISIFINSSHDDSTIQRLVPYLEGQAKVNGKATAYICKNYACQAPITDIKEFQEALD